MGICISISLQLPVTMRQPLVHWALNATHRAIVDRMNLTGDSCGPNFGGEGPQ